MAGRPAKRAPVKEPVNAPTMAKKFCPFDSERECGAECEWFDPHGAMCVAFELRDYVRTLCEYATELRRYV
jgi:hypothetical protein